MINNERNMYIEFLQYRIDHLRHDLQEYPNNKFNNDTYELTTILLNEFYNMLQQETYYSNQKYIEVKKLIENLINRNFNTQFTKEFIHIVNGFNQLYRYELINIIS